MNEEILNLKNEAFAQIALAKNGQDLEDIRLSYLGRNGKLNSLFKKIIGLPEKEKKEIGSLLNETKKNLEDFLLNKKQELLKASSEKRDWFDLSLPGIKPKLGHRHPLKIVLAEIKDIFRYLGYQVAEGPEIENDYYNFEALNMPPEHPARDTQMTFYLENGRILRTQTSAMQVRVMEKTKPPLRVLAPGRNFRYEQIDVSHSFEFWQTEGFAVDRDICFTDLLGTIGFVLKNLFGNNIKIRFATTNFPFVEPGVDTYLRCTICQGKGCPFCKGSGWSEIMPGGMIHPQVLKRGGIDPEKWRGFAFAIGLSRIVNLRYQINDLRVLNTPSLKILSQF